MSDSSVETGAVMLEGEIYAYEFREPDQFQVTKLGVGPIDARHQTEALRAAIRSDLAHQREKRASSGK